MTSAGARPPLSRDEFIEWVRREGEHRYHDHHRYHVLMHDGKLTQLQLQQWVLNRYYYQTRVPIKDALILSNSEDPTFRRMWIRRNQPALTAQSAVRFLSGSSWMLLSSLAMRI